MKGEPRLREGQAGGAVVSVGFSFIAVDVLASGEKTELGFLFTECDRLASQVGNGVKRPWEIKIKLRLHNPAVSVASLDINLKGNTMRFCTMGFVLCFVPLFRLCLVLLCFVLEGTAGGVRPKPVYVEG